MSAEERLEPAGRDPARTARRLAAGTLLALVILLVALVGVAGFAADRLYRTADQRYVREAFPLRVTARDLVVQMLNEETGLRGYLITGDRDSLGPYARGRANVAMDLAELARLARKRPRLSAAVDDVKAEVRAVQAYFASQIALVDSGREGQLEAQGNIGAARQRFDGFRIAAGALEDDIEELVRSAQTQQRATYRRTLAFLAAVGGAAVAIALALLLVIPVRLDRLYRREQAARLEAESGARASRALAHVAEGVVLVDGDDVVRYWNAAAGAVLGVAEAEALGRTLTTFVPELASGTDVPALVPVQVGGEERWLAAATTSFPEGRVVVLRDVTDERRLEQMRSDFVATAAHELRTPIAAVYGAARTLRREDVALPPETVARFLTMIENESERLGRIVDQILTSAALDGDELVLEPALCDVRAVCESVLRAIEVWRPPHVGLSLVLEGAVAPIVVDEGRLRQVLLNIAENAIKYSPEGGRVELRVVDGPERVRIEVLDEGMGVPTGERERIFEKFYRLDPSMSRGVGGSGLGLYISRQLVEQMGGSVTIEPNPGGGSVFTVELPRR